METNRYHVDVGVYLRMIRQDQQITQEGLALATTIHRETIVRMERGDSHVQFRNLLRVWAQLGVSPGTYALLAQSPTFSWSDARQTQRMTAAIREYLTLVIAQHAPPPMIGARSPQLRQPTLRDPFLTELTLLQLIIAWNIPMGDIAEILLANDDPQRVAIRQAKLRVELERQRAAAGSAGTSGYPVLVDAIRDLGVIANHLQASDSPHHVAIRQIAEDLDRLRIAMTLPFTIHSNR